ncbi:putative Ectonucleotide pyrophosphatase/phosphodiesterase family member 3 [Hypsibius exemplaris]|uniref:Ectonucleotide pyrophosphatase/phosphodiesterase family member 3 n=1 Tax=Hypsibius exemplaris TaxID=2072580 RepID=A0A1W0WPU4_HYPEX|nr:putative Ectonucleotide pyrophosphatase/phosphodiesterase family member 3 [Hypsibius exemplaris]
MAEVQNGLAGETVISGTMLAWHHFVAIERTCFQVPTARRVGTKGQEFGQTLRNLDNEIDRLLQNLFTKSLLPCTNIMIVSDHGLEDSTCTNAMDLTSILARNMQADHLSIPVSSNSFEFFGAGGHARVSIVPQPNSANPVHPYMLHNSLYCNHSQNQAVGRFYTLYNTDNMPRRLHFSDAIRIEREIAIAKLGRSVWKTTSGAACDKVIHGSDNIYPDMHGVFLAVGPSFRSAVPVETFSNVELYSVMAELVGLNPGPNNGTLGALQDALVTQTGIAPELTMPAYQRETFPTSEEMKKRQGQSCSYLIEGGLDEADKRLNMSETLSAKLVLANSAPYGVPGLLEIRLNMTLLVNHGFLLGYSFKYRLPLWSVLPVRAGTLEVPVTDGDVRAARPRNDVRLPLGSTLTCSDMESMPVSDSSPRVHPAYLVPTGLTGDLTDRTDANVVTNMVLMYQEFRRDVWAPLWERVAAALSAKGGLIFSGPVFDHAPQFGHADSPENITFSLGPAGTSVPLPSHYYLVALRNSDKLPASCIATKCHPDVLAFILPNSLETAQHPCQVSIDDYLQNHMATVKDVERISGLRLLVNLPPLEAVRLRTMLPNKLWW